MTSDYLSMPQGEFFAWEQNFLEVATPKAVTWGVPPAQMAELNSGQTAYEDAYNAGNKSKKGTRTGEQTQTLNEKTKSFKGLIRAFVKQFLNGNPAVTPTDRKALGITVYKTFRSASETPKSVPDIFIESLTGSRLKITARQQPDALGRASRGKPKEAAEFEVALWPGDNPPPNGDLCLIKVQSKRSPTIVNMNPSDAGKSVYGWGRWIGHKKQLGAWSAQDKEIIGN